MVSKCDHHLDIFHSRQANHNSSEHKERSVFDLTTVRNDYVIMMLRCQQPLSPGYVHLAQEMRGNKAI